jgi:hypothetical protein
MPVWISVTRNISFNTSSEYLIQYLIRISHSIPHQNISFNTSSEYLIQYLIGISHSIPHQNISFNTLSEYLIQYLIGIFAPSFPSPYQLTDSLNPPISCHYLLKERLQILSFSSLVARTYSLTLSFRSLVARQSLKNSLRSSLKDRGMFI